ncbi:hypothetical protein [Mesorhizobium sp. AA23]|uniref:hypothetical protein n=2 Tax=Mesorhizobium TaxID=68287 RepID=UPI0007FE7D37|nr:hypothetical protein [Mesorhizobium sp. AA23]OBQ91148.1 hypothetical protein A9K66_11860 [Mesorhizobium sp. AA23]
MARRTVSSSLSKRMTPSTGMHNVMFGRVVDIRHGSDEAALLYVGRNYMQPSALGVSVASRSVWR